MRNPVVLIFRAFLLCLKGRVHRCGDLENKNLKDCDEDFKAFRKVIVDPTEYQPEQPGAIFKVRFCFKNFSMRTNRLLSLIPIPLIVAQSGFRSKTWLLGQQTGDFIGYYEFDTLKDGEAYWNSLPLRMMRRRAAKGSLAHVLKKKEI